MLEEVITVAPLVPVTVTVSEPLVPGVVMTVSVLVVVPAAARVTGVGAMEQVPSVEGVTEQVIATDPAKLLTEARVTTSVLPVVAPEINVMLALAGVTVNVGPTTVTAIAELATTVLPDVPVTTTCIIPEVAAVGLIVRVVLPVPPEARVTEVGASEQVPVALPERLVTVQVVATAPAKVLTDAMVMRSVLPVVAPAASV